MSEARVSAIVLAGGRASRFGRDKLAEPIDGRSLLQHAVDGVRPLVTEVLVVAAPGSSPAVASDVRVVHDLAPFEGPLAGLLAGLGVAREAVVLVAGGDMPDPVPRVIQALLAELELTGADAAILDHKGRGRPLPMVVRREPALTVATRLIHAGERRLGALTDGLATTVIPEATWRPFDPAATTMRDIDTLDDLR